MTLKRKYIRRSLILIVVLVFLIIGLWFGLRALVTGVFTQTVSSFEQQGYEVSHEGFSVGGFPFTTTANVDNMTLHSDNRSVTLGKLKTSSAIFTPFSWTTSHQGVMKIDIMTAFGQRHVTEITPFNMELKAASSYNGKIKAITYTLDKAHISTQQGTPLPITKIAQAYGHLKIKNKRAHLNLGGAGFVFSDEIVGLLLPVLGNTLTKFDMDAVIENWPVYEEQGQAFWMENEGRLVSDHWALHWGRADITGTFDLQFEDGLPKGVVYVKVKDMVALLEGLEQAGLLPSASLLQIKTVISAAPTDDQGRQVFPFTLHEGTVKFGFITLFQFARPGQN